LTLPATANQFEYGYQVHGATYNDEYLWSETRKILQGYPPPRKLFELGCGNGFTAHRLAGLGYRVTAIDPSESGIAQARAAYPQINLFNWSAYDDLATEFEQFPVVVSFEVIEHCYDPRRFSRTMYNLLEPGGVGILSTPYHGYLKNLALALTGRLDSHFTALWDGGHIKFFSIATLRRLLEETGFKHIEF
jgi:2-polyprenyl-6-hydroxyphenyl methylase/3-demethylubiquinone-9 3-methyltransferase